MAVKPSPSKNIIIPRKAIQIIAGTALRFLREKNIVPSKITSFVLGSSFNIELLFDENIVLDA